MDLHIINILVNVFQVIWDLQGQQCLIIVAVALRALQEEGQLLKHLSRGIMSIHWEVMKFPFMQYI